MSETDPQGSRVIGLDLGTSRIVSAQCQDTDILFGTQLNAFTTIPFTKLTEGVLKNERIPYVVHDAEITVYGDESERFANLFHSETRRPMRRGILNPDELGGRGDGARNRYAGDGRKDWSWAEVVLQCSSSAVWRGRIGSHATKLR